MSTVDPDKIDSVADYLGKVAALPLGTDADDFFAYRGHSRSDWECLPGIARLPCTSKGIYREPNQTPKPAEYRLLLLFRDGTVPHQPAWVLAPVPAEYLWRQLVLGQHYRLRTRLLDWTTKPLVALFFAVEQREHWDADGAVHVMAANLKRRFTVSALARHNPDPPLYGFSEDVGVLVPPDIDARVTAQGSLFTIRKDPFVPVSASQKFVVAAANKERILRELQRLGITWGHLFPDMAGITRSINDECVTWDPEVL